MARAVPLDRSDVDTDQIIPSDWLKRVERTGFGEGLFSEWRESSDFVLNQEQFDGAQILVAGPNFGTGSSREHAPWALEDYGFRAVISARFADIFRNNCLKIGLLPVELPADVVTRIMRTVEDDPSVEIVIDVVDRRVAVPAIDLDEPFDLEDFHHYRLLEGLDDIGITLRHVADIDTFEARRPPGPREWWPDQARTPLLNRRCACGLRLEELAEAAGGDAEADGAEDGEVGDVEEHRPGQLPGGEAALEHDALVERRDTGRPLQPGRVLRRAGRTSPRTGTAGSAPGSRSRSRPTTA